MRRRAVNSGRPVTVPLPEAGSRNGVRRDSPGFPPGDGPSPPAWGREPVIYCAYPRAFGPRGNLSGVTERLGEIRALGADILWLLPVHPIGEIGRKGRLGSPYAIRDYRRVNPEYGDEADLAQLVRAAHEAGLRVIIDCVLNHGAPDHVMGGEHPDWLARDGRGRPTRRVRDWSDVVDWNFGASGLADHLLDVMEHWVRRTDIDGYRCDVAGMVPAAFWRQAFQRLSAVKPDLFFLAEWDDPAIHRTGFHASYDWELYRALYPTARAARSAADLSRIVTSHESRFPRHAVPMRFVENHDTRRAPRHLGTAARGAALFSALAGGAFLLYNGQEVGARHRPSLFEREPIDWNGPEATRERTGLAGLLQFRRALAGFGAPRALATSSDPAVAAYQREGESGRLIVLFNASVWPVSLLVAELEAGGAAILAEPERMTIDVRSPSDPEVHVPARSAMAIITN